MGYSVDYELSWDEERLNQKKVCDEVKRITGYGFNMSQDGDIFSFDIKWSDHESDMAKLSTEFPETLFTLKCVGEDNAMWTVFALGGRSYSEDAEIKITHPVFNEKKLT